MVPLQESPQCSNSNRFNSFSSSSSNSNSNSNSINISNNTKSHSWFMGRSMRTVRSNLYHHHSSSDTTTTTFHAAPIDNNLHHYQYSPSTEFLTDSVIDLRLGELAASHKSDLHWNNNNNHNNNNNNNNNIDSGSQSDNNNSESSFLCKLLQLDDLSRAFSASSSCSDISGELRRLAAATTTTNDVHDDEAIHNHHEEEEEPCPGFLERDSFSTEIIDIISPEDLLPTVKLCVDSLSSPSTSVRRSAAAKIRLLAKNRSDNRAMIGEYTGAVPSLIHLLRFTDPHTQEHAVTALLNLSLHDGNRDLMSDPVAVKSLIYVLKTGTETSKQNAACALLNLSLTNEGTRMTIGACGAILPLVSLLINGSTRGKKDALTTLYKLCSGGRVNKERAVSAGAVAPLVGMMMAEQQGQQQYCEGLMEKAMVVLSSLAGIGEGREAIVEEGGIAVLVEAIDHDEEVSRSHKVKEFAVMTLLQLCIGDDDDNDESVRRNRGLLIREGGIPPLAALSQSGTLKAKHKAETLLRYLREPRQEASTSASP